MGNGCSGILDFWVHLATTDEIRAAARSIEAWQKAQDANRAGGGPAVQQHATGALLYRLGGADVVKRIVEAFYRRLYANERLLVFLHDKDIITLRAKQSAFMSWLFGPPTSTYSGKSLRLAHLRLIKQRGFSPEDFETGLGCFADAMRELGAPESIINETINKIRPFIDIIFTASARDAEEARWFNEEQEKDAARQVRQQQLATGAAAAFAAAGAAASGSCAGRAAAVAGGGGSSSNSNSRPASAKGPQCPFTGGRFSRPGSSRVVPEGVSGGSNVMPAGIPISTEKSSHSGDLKAPSTPPLSNQTQPPPLQQQQPVEAAVEALATRPTSGAPPPAGTGSPRPGSPAAAAFKSAAAVTAVGAVEGPIVVAAVVAEASALTAPPSSPPLSGSRPASRPASSGVVVSAPLPLALPPPPSPPPPPRAESRRSASAAGTRPQSAAAAADKAVAPAGPAASRPGSGSDSASKTVQQGANGADCDAAAAEAAVPAAAAGGPTDIVDAFLSEVFADESRTMVEEALAELGDLGGGGAAAAAASPAAAAAPPAAAAATAASPAYNSPAEHGTGIKSLLIAAPQPAAAAAAAAAVTPRTGTPLTASTLGLGGVAAVRPTSQQVARVC